MAIRLLTLEGTPEQMGSAHGETLREEIRDCLARWLDELAATYPRDPAELISGFHRDTSLVRTAERLTPDLHAELSAIARAADVDPDLLWAWNLLDEVWWYAGSLERGEFAVPGGTACSSVGILRTNSGAPLVAQNMDLDAFMTWDPYLLRLRPAEEEEALVLVNPGVLAQCGVNAAGVAVTCNALSMMRPSGDGLPVTLIVREVLRRSDIASIRELMQAVPHASGQNYLVGTPEGLLDFECSAGKVVQLGDGEPFIAHTNHPLVNDDIAHAVRRQNSYDRIAFLEGSLGPGATRAAVLTALSDRSTPVCKTGDMGRTYASMVMELTTPPSVWVAAGPPTADAYEPVPF